MVTLNNDCIEKIFDYLEQLKHVERNRNILKKISRSAACLKINRITNYYDTQHFQTAEYWLRNFSYADHFGLIRAVDFQEYLWLNTTKEERLWFLYELNKCKCCKRHQINRPTVVDYVNLHDGQYEYIEKIGEHDNIDRDCACSCRHLCRQICFLDNSI